MTKRSTNPDFLNGVPELVVLELLSRRPMYGYELVQAIKESSDGALEFGEGCIYPLLHKLEARGDLAARRIDVGGRSRVVYRVTPKGTRQRAASLAQWAAVVESVGRILQGGKYEHQHVHVA
jgi:PadR family transcriptional regulator PadR